MYKVKVWCRDCCGYDFLGCFDGVADYIYSNQPPYEPALYPSISEAAKAGYEEINGGPPWEFEIEDLEGNILERYER